MKELESNERKHLMFRAKYCTLLEREVAELRSQVTFLREIIDGAQSDEGGVLTAPGIGVAARGHTAMIQECRDSPMQMHGPVADAAASAERPWPEPIRFG
eukprot:CAMPEP_0177590156 /NCGR_PEP_ID=MMETSP0419_2-20121207/7231_1 /TAXON_ID=582737 /ORGANISM="Tetraselmis sp., Strain GSL018" /LENGTH=99 /DNA_ID=CAMNT_0019080647 /DNA_START=253 /DNA_END=548 /DNA_ORIENTATION=+